VLQIEGLQNSDYSSLYFVPERSFFDKVMCVLQVVLFVVHKNYAHLRAVPRNPPTSLNPSNPSSSNPPFTRMTRSNGAMGISSAYARSGPASGRMMRMRRSVDVTTPLLGPLGAHSSELSGSPDCPLFSLTWQALGIRGGNLGAGRSGAVCLGE
jgi:hypothetical protein